MDGVGVHKLSNVRSSGLDFAKILSRKLYSSISTWGHRRIVKTKKRINQDGHKSIKENNKAHTQRDGYIYTGRIQYPSNFVNWHIVRLSWVTHPTVSLQEEVTALPVVVGV